MIIKDLSHKGNRFTFDCSKGRMYYGVYRDDSCLADDLEGVFITWKQAEDFMMYKQQFVWKDL